ncbi:DUF1419 domain-containing protein [Rhizobium mongolense]|uniref:DUF1419 domain-containing protein n=1 Tax=Rhizobium mongolense TaxID=57676 RepID=UPI0035565E13
MAARERADHFAMREFQAAQVTSVFFSLKIDGRFRWFHGYCDLADAGSIDDMRGAIIERESRPVRAMSRAEKLEHIWSITGPDFRAFADQRFAAGFAGRRMVMVFTAAQAKIHRKPPRRPDARGLRGPYRDKYALRTLAAAGTQGRTHSGHPHLAHDQKSLMTAVGK